MGRPKLLLPFEGRTILERVIAALKKGGVNRVLVVAGPSAADLVPIAQSAGTETLALDEDTADMRATIVYGLDWLAAHERTTVDDNLLILPGDHPLVDASVVEKLIEARRTSEGKSIVVPTYHGKRGHPVLISWQLANDIKAIPPGHGLNALLHQNKELVLELAIGSSAVVQDMDTPEDYDRLVLGH